MTYASGDPLVATLPFGIPEAPTSEGLLVLYADGSVQLLPSAETRSEFDAFTASLSERAVAWGASLVVGLAAVGGLLWMRRRKGGAWTLFALSGLAGLGGAYARREAGRIAASLTRRHSIGTEASVTRTRSGGISLSVREPGLPPWSVSLSPDEFDKAQGEAFLRAVSGR